MINQNMYALGANRSCIRELFEYGRQRAAIVGPENVFDYSLGNPSIPSPPEIDETIRQILADTDPLQIHGYTSAIGDLQTRQAIADDLNARYGVDTKNFNFRTIKCINKLTFADIHTYSNDFRLLRLTMHLIQEHMRMV